MNKNFLALSTALTITACEKPEHITPEELAVFAAQNDNFEEKTEPENLKVIEATIAEFRAARDAQKIYHVDFRDEDRIKKYKNDPKYKELLYIDDADIRTNGSVEFTWFNPEIEARDKEQGNYNVYLHTTGYTVTNDEPSGRKILKIEEGNLLESGTEDSNATWTTTVDMESGIVTSYDDGDRAFDDNGFALTHEDGKLLKNEEKYYDSRKVESNLATALRNMERLSQKLYEKAPGECE